MLHIESKAVRERIKEGRFGLEKEGLRVREDGFFAHTVHPFPNDKRIVRDFCENQIEVNTTVHDGIGKALQELREVNRRIEETLWQLPEREYLWPSSNPPYIRRENDIPIAKFVGEQEEKTQYRQYLAEKYGRYKMTFSGIHFNFSFSDEVLKTSFLEDPETDYGTYKDRLYLELAKKVAMYGWLLVAITAASPVLDRSFVEKGVYGEAVFTGMASVRCSEMGYWNAFPPVLCYDSLAQYADSIQAYVDKGFLKAPSEFYYPVRLKPSGENTLEGLRKKGVDHIELRMIDVNPLAESGVEEKDLRFAHLFLIWLAALPEQKITELDQVHWVQNFKQAARYDLKTVKIWTAQKGDRSIIETAKFLLEQMEAFYEKLGWDEKEIIRFQYEKFLDAENRYAWKLRKQYGNAFVKTTLESVKERWDA